MNDIKDNIKEIEENIRISCEKRGNDCSDITLLCVSKTIDTDRIETAIESGLVDLGENKVQEIRAKYDVLKDKARFHMIGHLQRNKVKYIIDKVDLIHSVDSIRLIEKIDEEAKKIDKIMPILLQVNIADEDTKYGMKKEELYDIIDKMSNYDNITVKGLMAIAPYVVNPEDNRKYFRQMYQLFVDIDGKNIDNIDMRILSMGMTNDYMVAIEEGANMIRIGTGIFGRRIYN